MHLLPPFVTTHHQNVAFPVFLLIVVLVRQSISDDPSQSSSDQSSSDQERRRPMQPRAIPRSMSVQSRGAHSGPLVLGRSSEMNEPQRNVPVYGRFRNAYSAQQSSQPLVSSYNSQAPSLENSIKALEDESKMKTNAQKIEKQLCDYLEQIQKNIPRPNRLKEHFKRLFSSKDKNNDKKQSKNAELTISDKLLNDKSNENACEQLLLSPNPNTGKPYKDYALRVEACRKLNALTGWVAVKEAINAIGNSKQCTTIYEDDDDDGNGIGSLSKRSNSFGSDRYGSGRPESSSRDKGKSKTAILRQFFNLKKKKEKVNDYLPSPKGNNGCSEQRSISFRDVEYENRQMMHRNLIEPRRSLDIVSEQIVSRTKNADMSQTLKQNSIQRSTSTQSTNFGFDFGLDNASTGPNSLQRSTSSRSNDNGTLPRHSMQRSTSSRSTDFDNALTRHSMDSSTSSRSPEFGSILTWHSVQPSTSSKSTDFGKGNGTLTRQRSTSSKSIDFGFGKRKMQQNFVEGRRSLDERNSSYTEIGDRSKNLPCALQRTSSTRNPGMARSLSGRRSLDERNSSYTEIGDRSKNLPCALPRSFSSARNTGIARSLSVGAELFDMIADEEDIFKEPIIYTVQWDVLRTGMLCMRDRNLKKNILAKCQRVNYELQLLILQTLLLKTKPKCESNEGKLEVREQIVEIGDTLLKFVEVKNGLVDFLNDRISSKGRLGEESIKALVELRDKVVAHWTWLYEQHDG
ncbi:hypothetical protein GPALN_004582 [Globodera pallida]|nr:hypothetical protein GPALN_004582 [Globodera pallida]